MVKRKTGAVLLLVAVALMACGKKDEGAGGPPHGMGGPPEVTVAAAVSRPIAETVEFPARLEAVEQVQIRSRVTGYIQGIHFQQGAEVHKGDLLFTIDARTYEAQARAAESQVAALNSRIDMARIALARNEKLLATQATSQREVDEAGASVKDLEATLRGAQAQLESAKLDVSFTRVLSPITGRVGKAEITVGNLVQANGPESPVLTTVVSSNPVYVSFDADEHTFVRFGLRGQAGKSKLEVGVGLSGETGFPHQARLDYVDNRVDPGTGGVKIRALLANPDGALTPGLFARVKLSDPSGGRDAVVVSERAIGTDQDRKYVFVVGADKTAQVRPIKPGPLVDGMRVIYDGLKPGEMVIVNGLMRIRPGVPVTAKLEAAADAGAAAPLAAEPAKPADKAADKPMEKPTEKPTEKPMEKAAKPMEKPASTDKPDKAHETAKPAGADSKATDKKKS